MATTARKAPAKRASTAAKSPLARPAAETDKAPDVPAKPTKPVKKATLPKPERIRGTFAMPKTDYARIAKLKATAKRAGIKVKKNELLQLGLQSLQSLSSGELQDRILALRLPDKRTKA